VNSTDTAAPAAIPVQGTRVLAHDADRGFCSFCGAVWPCARARSDQRQATDPFA